MRAWSDLLILEPALVAASALDADVLDNAAILGAHRSIRVRE